MYNVILIESIYLHQKKMLATFINLRDTVLSIGMLNCFFDRF